MAMVVLSFGGKEIKTYQLTKPATVVGRDPGVDIVIDNLGVSRSHCQFLRRGSAYILQDMNSSNGTYVNGQKIGEHFLNSNDQIVVGKYTLTFKNEQQTAAAPAEKIVPDSLNTYMMDGQKIRERLEEMRKAEQAKSAGAGVAPAAAPPEQTVPTAPAVAPVPAPAAAPAAAADRGERRTKIIMGAAAGVGPSPATLKIYLYVSLALNIVLAVVLCWLMVKQMAP